MSLFDYILVVGEGRKFFLFLEVLIVLGFNSLYFGQVGMYLDFFWEFC